MSNLRKSALLMILFLTVAFNMERIDFGSNNLVDISSFVYVLMILSICSIMLLPTLQQRFRLLTTLFWIVLYLLLRYFIFEPHPQATGFQIYLTITELVLIVLANYLAFDLSQNLEDFETIIEKVTIPSFGHKLYTLDEADNEVRKELARSRRYRHPLSVLVIEPKEGTISIDLQRILMHIQKRMMSRYVMAGLGQVIVHEARRTDLITIHEARDRFIVVCPETNPEGAGILARRIEAGVKQQLGAILSCGIATLSEETLTFDELIKSARFHLIHPDINHAAPRVGSDMRPADVSSDTVEGEEEPG